jgi:hypothetical protein
LELRSSGAVQAIGIEINEPIWATGSASPEAKISARIAAGHQPGQQASDFSD